MEKNEEIKEAMEELEEVSKIKQLRRIAELKDKAIRDEKNGLRHAREEGREEEKIKIAKRLLKIGLTTEQVIEATEFSKEEIEKIKNTLH